MSDKKLRKHNFNVLVLKKYLTPENTTTGKNVQEGYVFKKNFFEPFDMPVN